MSKTREWRKFSFAQADSAVNLAEKFAKEWLAYMEQMEQNADKIQIIRYEDFIYDPPSVIRPVAELLNLDPSAFNYDSIHTKSAKLTKDDMSTEDLNTIQRVAGDMMARYHYI